MMTDTELAQKLSGEWIKEAVQQYLSGAPLSQEVLWEAVARAARAALLGDAISQTTDSDWEKIFGLRATAEVKPKADVIQAVAAAKDAFGRWRKQATATQKEIFPSWPDLSSHEHEMLIWVAHEILQTRR